MSPPGGFSLRRWSVRKLTAAAQKAPELTPEAAQSNRVPADAASESAGVPTRPQPPAATAAAPAESPPAKLALPPIDSLTPQSDFAAFMQPGVEPSLRRAALHKLFADPHFNAMDGLDVYIDDYSKESPIAPDVVKMLNHARYIFAPPQTRVNAQGFVEDVPEEELAEAQEPEPPVAPAEVGGAPPDAIAQTQNIAVPPDVLAKAEAPAERATSDDAPAQIRLPFEGAPDPKP